ncbi:MAG: GtrA family protein [Clostridiaceae bacterium]
MKKNDIIEFIKYALVGSSNVLIDFIILNTLMHFTGIYQGSYLILFNIASFLIYSTNGYILNKKFTFKSEKASYFLYILVLGSAMIVNSLILFALSVNNTFSLDQVLWANISKLIASITSGIVSFLINKFLVFNKPSKVKNR